MPQQPDVLFPQIANFSALYAAAQLAASRKRRKQGVSAFMANLEKNILQIEYSLQQQTWRSGGYTEMELTYPKKRLVSAAPFRDRVVHHALCAVIAPKFEKGFIEDSFANRKGKGSHLAVARYEQFRNRYRYVLRADIYRYFPAMDHEILKADIRRRISCPQTLWLIDSIIDSANPQEPVYTHFPGDDLLSPLERKKGLPIGNLTSQLFGNVYLNAMDHFIKEVLRAPYVRYVDDFALFHNDLAVLQLWQQKIAIFLEKRRLLLHPRKTFIASTKDPAEFLGFVLLPHNVRRLPEHNVRNFRNRLRGLRDRWRAGSAQPDYINQRVQAWIAHAKHAHTWRLRQALFRSGWFDPLREPDDLPRRRVLRGGAWNNNDNNCRAAYRNNNSPANRNNNNGFRLASTPHRARALVFSQNKGRAEVVHGSS